MKGAPTETPKVWSNDLSPMPVIYAADAWAPLGRAKLALGSMAMELFYKRGRDAGMIFLGPTNDDPHPRPVFPTDNTLGWLMVPNRHCNEPGVDGLKTGAKKFGVTEDQLRDLWNAKYGWLWEDRERHARNERRRARYAGSKRKGGRR